MTDDPAGTRSGPSPYWLDIAREYTERWVHGAQIRLAVGARPLLERHWLHPVLDTFMRCLPRAYEAVPARLGTLAIVEVGGEAGGRWHVRRGAERWHLVPPADQQPRAHVTFDIDTAWRLLSRTITPDAAVPAISIAGDHEIGRTATRAVAIMTTRL